MTAAERRAVATCVVETAAGRVPVLIGAGAERTEDAIENAIMAAEIGADGIMVIPPFYSTPTEAELVRHYERIAGATTLPVMIYNNPATANVDLTPPLVARLSEIDHIDYIKESTMDVTRVRDIIDLCGDRMTVFGGIMGYESFCNGAEGWVAVGSNIMPGAFARLFELTADAEDHHAARRLYADILPIIRLVGGHRYVSATKSALELIDMPVGGPRSPRLPTPAEEMDRGPRRAARRRPAAAEGGLTEPGLDFSSASTAAASAPGRATASPRHSRRRACEPMGRAAAAAIAASSAAWAPVRTASSSSTARISQRACMTEAAPGMSVERADRRHDARRTRADRGRARPRAALRPSRDRRGTGRTVPRRSRRRRPG